MYRKTLLAIVTAASFVRGGRRAGEGAQVVVGVYPPYAPVVYRPYYRAYYRRPAPYAYRAYYRPYRAYRPYRYW